MEFWHGLLIGLAYSAPIGIQNLFVINTALSQTRRCSIITAFWVIVFDTILALACFYGVGLIMQQIKWLQMLILLVGSFVVIYMGIGLLRSKAMEIDKTQQTLPLAKIISTACIVTWGNPQAFIDGTMMLGAFQAALPADSHFSFISGVVSASCLWFSSIIVIVSAFGKHLNSKILQYMNIICGLVIIFYGLKLLLQFINSL